MRHFGHSRTARRDRLLHARDFIISVPQMEVYGGVKFTNLSCCGNLVAFIPQPAKRWHRKAALKCALVPATTQCLSFLMCCTIGTASNAQHLLHQIINLSSHPKRPNQSAHRLATFVDKYRSPDSGVRSFQGAGNGHDNVCEAFSPSATSNS